MSDEEKAPTGEMESNKVISLFDSNPNVDRLHEKINKVLDKYAYGKMSRAEVLGVIEIMKAELIAEIILSED